MQKLSISGIHIGHLHGVDDQLDIQIVLLILAVAQRGHHRKGVAEQAFLQVGVAVGVAVHLAQQDIPANLHLFNDGAQQCDPCRPRFPDQQRPRNSICPILPPPHFRFSGFRHSSSGRTKRPSLRMSTSSKQDLAAAAFRGLDQHQVPVERSELVAVVAVRRTQLPGVKWMLPMIFSSKRVSFMGSSDVGVDADGEFTHIARAFVDVEHVVDTHGVVGRGFDDFAVSEGQADVFKGEAVLGGGRVVGNRAVDAAAHRRGVDFAVGNVAVAGALDGGHALDGEGQVGSPGRQAHPVRPFHQRLQRIHGAIHAGIVHGAHVEVELA